MENQNDKKQFTRNEGESNDKLKDHYSLNDDNIAFVPVENIRAIEKVIRDWEAVNKLWEKTNPLSPQVEGFLPE
jgi:hypothetical protein